MTRKVISFCLGMGIFLLLSCTSSPKQPQGTDVIMHTELGDVYIDLYDETPSHKKNFLKLAREDFFDGQAFHRIINNFMVQVGDPRTRTSFPPKDTSKANDAGYTLPAEIIDSLAHTYGKIGAARKDTSQNPDRRSSSSQFYIVTGRRISVAGLDSVENERTGILQGQAYDRYKALRDSTGYSASFLQFLDSTGFRDFSYPLQQEKAYRTLGGAPWLDNRYTIFGEVLEGMEVIEKIQIVPTNPYELPLRPVRILDMELVEN